jgi:hypothetical protein
VGGVEVLLALRRARLSIIAIAMMHAIALIVGMLMVHVGNSYALTYRDKLVSKATATDPVSLAYARGDSLRAALIESARTQWACLASAITGLTVISPFVLSAYRGWVGGIVSVDSSHISRLVQVSEATYYLSVVVLQLIPYSLAGGAGVNLGLTYFRKRADYQGERWIGYPKEAIRDFVWILILTIPFVLSANLWEFLSPLNR